MSIYIFFSFFAYHIFNYNFLLQFPIFFLIFYEYVFISFYFFVEKGA